ncbi:MAG: alkaline phosphatase PhoX [Deltaproteobacteria bacterium]
MKQNLSRRTFIKTSAIAAGGVALTASTLDTLTAHTAWAQNQGIGGRGRSPQAVGYGALFPARDQNREEILALPPGFQYITFGRTGELMSDGTRTPRNLDGMAAFPGPNGTIRLIRNHEVRNAPNDLRGAVGGPANTKYDPLGVGGTVTLDYDPIRRRLVRDFVSLNGTIVNCAGGFSFGDSGWITCEETVAGPNQGWGQKHGYSFLVPASANSAVSASPITAMGRFSHEACVADFNGIVYQTEDAGSGRGSGFYRYIPNNPNNLLAGGSLQILAIKNIPQYDTREGQTVGQVFPIEWVAITTPDPDLENGATSVFNQGFAQGAALFNRLEGIWRGDDGSIFFVSTSGGDAKSGDVNSDGFREGYGQLWHFRATSQSAGLLTLVFESSRQSELDSPDNIVVTPRGGILFCEDDAGGNDDDTHPLAPGVTDVNRLIGLTPKGEPFEFAVNRLSDFEFAGACFSPDGNILFVNIFGNGEPRSGMTCAITGPWRRGPL